MKALKLILLAAMLATLSACSSLPSGHPTQAETKKLRHVVGFKFKPGVTAEQMQKVDAEFRALQGKVPQITEFEGGTDLHAATKAGKWTQVYTVTVKDEKDLALYGSHPDHKAFSKMVDPLLAEVMVVDYWK